ncbi:MAG: esterase [Luteibaculaceae bacterium]|jgi:esterase
MLHCRVLGEGDPLFIVHGLFGSSDNWQALAKRYAEHFQVYLVDQRNHGHSLHTNDVFDYDLMAADLVELMDHHGLSSAHFLGHSMGGKSVMRLAQIRPDLVDKLISADMGIKGYPPHHDAILKGLNTVDLDVQKSRKEVEVILAEHIPDFSVRMFLMKNLYWAEKGKLGWRINIPVLTRDILNVVAAIPEQKVAAPTLFIIGGASNYVLEKDEPHLKDVFPMAQFEKLDGVGHWLHAEAPEDFYKWTLDFLLE